METMDGNLWALCFAFLPLSEVLTSVNLVCSTWFHVRKNVSSSLIAQVVPTVHQIASAGWNMTSLVSLHVTSSVVQEQEHQWDTLKLCVNVSAFHLYVTNRNAPVNWTNCLDMLATLRELRSLSIDRAKHQSTLQYIALNDTPPSLEAVMCKLTSLELTDCFVSWANLVCPELVSVQLSTCKIPGRLFAFTPKAFSERNTEYNLDFMQTSPCLEELSVANEIYVRNGVWITSYHNLAEHGSSASKVHAVSCKPPCFPSLKRLQCNDIVDIKEVLQQAPNLEALTFVEGSFTPFSTLEALSALRCLKELDLAGRSKHLPPFPRGWLQRWLRTLPALETLRLLQTGFVKKDAANWLFVRPTLQTIVLCGAPGSIIYERE